MKMLMLLAMCLALTTGSAALAFGVEVGSRAPGSTRQIIGFVGMAFFGAMLLLLLWRSMTQLGPVVTLSLAGFTDTRIAPEEIPWSAIRDVSTWSYRGSEIMVLAVDPAVEASLSLTPIARWSRGPNKVLGVDGLCVNTTDLAISHANLLQATSARLAAAKARA